MNWIKKQIIDWALRQQERKKVELKYRGESVESLHPMTSSGRTDDIFWCVWTRTVQKTST
jgi:hypothetical protein